MGDGSLLLDCPDEHDMELIIPDDQKRPFEILFKLGPPQRKALVDGLRSIKPAISLRNLAGALGQTVSLASDDLYEILRMLASLNDLRTEQLEED